jgi:type II secretory pathway component PulF
LNKRPLIYAGVSLVVACAVHYVVFPGFVDTYAETGGQLPRITQLAIDAGDGKLIYVWAILFGATALTIAALASLHADGNSPARRHALVLTASAVTTLMLLVAVFFLAAIVTPMISTNA